MEEKSGILKNVEKFYDIKLCKGLNLSELKTTPRIAPKNQSTISCARFKNYWFHLDGGTALFKTYDGEYKKEARLLRIANELICEKLANQIDLPCAKYEPAHYGNFTGLITHNFLKEKQSLLTLNDFLMINSGENSLVDIAEACDLFKAVGYKIDKKKTIYDIYKIMIFDALTLQTDRHAYNVNMLKDNKNFTISVAKIIDNEFAFDLELFETLKGQKSVSIPYLLQNHSLIAKTLTVNGNHLTTNKFKQELQELVNLAKSDENMMEILKNSIHNFRVKQAVAEVEKMGLEINDEYLEYISMCSNYTKRIFLHELKKNKTEDTRFIYDEYLNIK